MYSHSVLIELQLLDVWSVDQGMRCDGFDVCSSQVERGEIGQVAESHSREESEPTVHLCIDGHYELFQMSLSPEGFPNGIVLIRDVVDGALGLRCVLQSEAVAEAVGRQRVRKLNQIRNLILQILCYYTVIYI